MVGSFLNTAARPTLKNVFIKDYQNLTVVIEQVIHLRNRTKPSVNSEDHSAPASAATQISSIDAYRPSSLVLISQPISSQTMPTGAPTLMQDTYPVDIQRDIQRSLGPALHATEDVTTVSATLKASATKWSILPHDGGGLCWERFGTVGTVPQGFGAAK